MDLQTVIARLRSRWWVVAGVAALALLGAVVALATRTDHHERTMHFVLRPASSVPVGQLPGALDELKSDGALVQTVLGVLGGPDILRRAAAQAKLPVPPGYEVTSSARPSSALIDSTVAGPDAKVVDRLGSGLVQAATDYVQTSYSAYTLDVLGSSSGGSGTGLDAAQAIVLAVILGAALGVGLVVAEMRLEPRLRAVARGTERAATDTRCRATTSKGTPCRNRPVDERGYCRRHLARAGVRGSEVGGENGSGAVIGLAEPPVPPPPQHRFSRMGPHASGRHEDEG
jgi:hypothetical protein